MALQIHDENRVRTLTLDRPDALNAFDEALYDATADALLAAAEDPDVAVVLLTGAGRAFSAGTDLLEMHRMSTDPDFQRGRHGFPGLLDALVAFPKPLVVAVNGIALGIGATVLGFADLAFMSSTARLKCPFTSLGVAPEAASSFLFPRLVGPPGRRVDAAVVGVGERRRRARRRPGVAGHRARRPDGRGPHARGAAGPSTCLVAGGRQARDDRSPARRHRRRPRAARTPPSPS